MVRARGAYTFIRRFQAQLEHASVGVVRRRGVDGQAHAYIHTRTACRHWGERRGRQAGHPPNDAYGGCGEIKPLRAAFLPILALVAKIWAHPKMGQNQGKNRQNRGLKWQKSKTVNSIGR